MAQNISHDVECDITMLDTTTRTENEAKDSQLIVGEPERVTVNVDIWYLGFEEVCSDHKADSSNIAYTRASTSWHLETRGQFHGVACC